MAGKTSKKQSGGGSWLLILFGLPFLAVGVGMFYSSCAMVARWVQADTWIATEATIRSLDLERHTDSEGSTSYEVLCTYEYTYQGETCTGNRVGLAGGSDSVGSWQERTHKRLKEHFDREEPIACYVDPSDPTQAVLDRSFRLELFGFHWIFVITFGGAGAGCVIGGWYLRRSLKRRAELQAQYPDEPWAWNTQWRDGVLRTSGGLKAAVIWGIAIFWNTLGGWPVFFIPEELRKGNYLILLVLLFPLVGLLLLWGAIHATMAWRRFGRSTFAMKTMPGVVGGHLRGTLSIVGQLSAMDGVDVSLRCVHKWVTGSGKHRNTHTETLYEDKRNYPVSQRFGEIEARLPIDFQIPYECRPMDDNDSSDSIEWELKAEADIPGVDLSLEFKVPVYRTAESDPQIGRSTETIAAEEAVITSDEPPQPRKVRISRDAGGLECIECSSWPGAGTAFATLFGSVLCLGVAVFSIYLVIRGEYFMLIFLCVFGLIWVGTLVALLSYPGRWRVSFGLDEVAVERVHAIGRSRKEIPRDRIARIEYKESYRTNDMPRFAMHLVAEDGAKVKIAGSLQSEQMAKWLAYQVESRLGLEDAVQRVESSSGKLRQELERRKND